MVWVPKRSAALLGARAVSDFVRTSSDTVSAEAEKEDDQ